MVDKRIQQTKKIFVETDYDNIIVVNPNEIYDVDNNRAPRFVDQEDLVFYANLETFIIPRTKLAIGETFDSPVVNTTVATLFNGQDDLRLNFLQPKGKTAFDTSWSDQLTGFESRLGQGANQKTEQIVTIDGKPRFQNSIAKYEDTQLLGIKTINVNIKGTGVPEVTIEMVDIQGRALFEQGESSIYSAFFNFPYPLFYLTLKGYYGKAIRYRLSLLSFNARFDAGTGNYNISLKLVGKFTALLFDTPLQYAITAPKMYNTEVTIKDTTKNNVTTLNTYKGRQKLDEVYQIYKRKGLLDANFPQLSIEEFIYRANNYAKKAEEDAKNKGDFSKLNDIQDYKYNLSKLKESVYNNSVNNFLDNSSYYVLGNLIYYPYKKDISDQTQKDYETKIKERIDFYVSELQKNETFGKGKSYEINVDITTKDILKNINFASWLNNSDDIIKTYFYRTGKQLDITTPEGVQEFNKFKLDEEKNAELFKKVLDADGNIIEDESFFYVFGDKRVADGTFEPNSFLDKLDRIEKTLLTNEEIIEKELSQVLADRQLKNPDTGGLGFRPTIRNIFAIIFAGADAFYRLMEDTHQSAWDVRDNPTRLSAVIPPDKNFSVDGKDAIQYAGRLNKDNVIYPWPLYFVKEKQADQRELYTIQYPGDAKVIKQTRAFDYTIWPEIGFVEAYLKGVTETAKPTTQNVYNNPADYSSYVSANALEFPFKTPPYQDLAPISFFYELFERTYIASHYGNLINDVVTKKQVDKFYGDIESKNVQLSAGDAIEINQILKNYKFNYTSYLEYLKKISNDGSGDSWQTFIRSQYKTDYLRNLFTTEDEIYSIDTISNRSIQISSDLPLAKNLQDYLDDTASNKLTFLDTYPLTDTKWINDNTSYNTPEDANDTTGLFVYLDDKKTIARLNESNKYTEIKLFFDDTINNYSQPYISVNNVPVTTRQLLKDYYIFNGHKSYITEETYFNEDDYNGNLKNEENLRYTSFLNTPYFINSIIDGVEKNKNNVENPFTALGYIFLNSLPLVSQFFEPIESIEFKKIFNTFKKYSAIHQVPYAWILRFGSLWYRYKRYVNENYDILDDVWKNFDYVKNYDPITSASTLTYVVPDYSGNPINVNLQKTENFPLPSTQVKDLVGTGFYPNVINSVYNFITGNDLLTGYTQNDFQAIYNEKGFRLGKNNNATSNLNFGFDPNNTNRSLQKTNYFSYVELSAQTQQYYMLFPSMGGIPIDESVFECVNSSNVITEEILNNNSVYNGSTRALWAVSNFGYFKNKTKPKVTEGILRFDVYVTRALEQLFSVFSKEMLDKFEEKFLSFCNPKPVDTDLILEGEITTPTYYDANKLKDLNFRRLHTVLKSLFLVNKTGVTLGGEDVDGKTLGEKQIMEFSKSMKDFLSFDCIIKIGNPGKFDRLLFNSFSNLTTFVPEKDKLTFAPYIKGALPGDGTNVTLLQSITQNPSAWNALRLYLGFSTIPGVDYENQLDVNFPSTSIAPPTPNVTTYAPPVVSGTSNTFKDLCTNQIFNVTDPNNLSTVANNYTNDTVWYLKVLDNSGSQRNFCATKITNDTGVTTNYNLLTESNTPQSNTNPASYCLSFFSSLVNCPTNTLTNSVQFKLVGDSSSIIPGLDTNSILNSSYFNIVKPTGGYQVIQIVGDSNFTRDKIGQILFYKANTDITDITNIVQSTVNISTDTNDVYVCEVNNNTSGNYQIVVEYFPNGPTDLTNPIKLIAPIITGPPQQQIVATFNNTTPPVVPLPGSPKSYVADFFIDMDIAFTEEYVKTLVPLIRIYVTQKIKDPTLNKVKFTSLINQFLTDQQDLQTKMLNETFTSLNKNLKEISVNTNVVASAVSGDVGKLTLYNTLKAFNDKWIAGSDLKYVTLFEDFLFMDRANSDIGDVYVVDIDQIIKRLDVKSNPDMNLMTVVSNILSDNQFMFFAMPAYINFYGIQQAIKNGKPIDIDIPNSLFGTYLEVDYTDSSPKFLCLYMGNPSEYPKPKENSFIRFDDDSFDLRIPDNPLRISDPNRDYSKTNRVVGFSVDFGIQNQSIFKEVDLDMSEMKNTSESFKVFADIGSSVAGDKVAQQSVSMYSIYKSRSYSCGVSSMGCAMIQPTMYFVLRHVPLFYGPYWIYEVTHNISENAFTTNFKGTRIPKYSLPNVDNLVMNTNAKLLQSYKEKIKTEKVVTEEEKKITIDPVITPVSAPTNKCVEVTKYQSLPFVDISKTIFTLEQVIPLIKNATTDNRLRALLYGLATTRPLNSFNGAATTFEISNLNFFEISTENKFNGSMDTYLTEQVCIDVQGTTRAFASFTANTTSFDFMVSFYTQILPLIENLKTLNTDTNIYKEYGKALAQIAVTTWETARAFGPPLLSGQQIKDLVLQEYNDGNFATYPTLVELYTVAYQAFETNQI